jgi:hypothetical protein
MAKTLFPAVLASISCMWVSQALSADMAVFGIPLAQEITFPECPKGVMGYGIARQICFERMDAKLMGTGPVANGNIYIRFPLVESPSIVSGNSLIGLILEGRL